VFTGLVESLGTLARKTSMGLGAELCIRHPLGLLTVGESVAVAGCCLTVVSCDAESFTAEASQETLARTTLGKLTIGGRVNLERAMLAGGRFGGHLVSGHIDGVGALQKIFPIGLAVGMSFTMPEELAKYVAEKGSICIEGISLTVNRASHNSFDVAIIRHTEGVTTLQSIAVGTAVNLEVDLVARYLDRLMSGRADSSPPPNRLANLLTEKGYR
jgi:riboflavin synthase